MNRYPTRRLDFSWIDWLIGIWFCLRHSAGDRARIDFEREWTDEADSLATLSVRSAFDLFLEELKSRQPGLPGSILFSAMTIGDMPLLARAHGFRVESVDLEPESIQVSLQALTLSLTPDTRAVVVTQLFGAACSLEAIARVLRPRGILLIEDAAQAFGSDGYRGDRDADISMFSFGPIKTSTALGGGLMTLRTPGWRDSLAARQQDFAVQRNVEFLRRLLKYGLLKLVSDSPLLYGLLVRLLAVAGNDPQRVIESMTRGFSGGNLLDRLRKQPSSALLRMLARRIRQENLRIQQRIAVATRLRELLAEVTVPAADVPRHSWWLFPILHPRAGEFIRRLRNAGFDATGSRTLEVIDPDRNRHASELEQKLVCLPLIEHMSPQELLRMSRIVNEF